MKRLFFKKTYFKDPYIFEDKKSGIRIEITETSSMGLTEEYSLRIKTRHGSGEMIYRDYAIENHPPPNPHDKPHLQFKFHKEGLKQFRIFLNLAGLEEYKQGILGFIFQIGRIIAALEKECPGITEKVMYVDQIKELEQEGRFLIQKIEESCSRNRIEFDDGPTRGTLNGLGNHQILIEFLGKDNVREIIKNNST